MKIDMVRRTPDEGLWDQLVDKYHYLGSPRIVGAYLKVPRLPGCTPGGLPRLGLSGLEGGVPRPVHRLAAPYQGSEPLQGRQ
ncbi:hypothetical protein TRIP_B330557 [uncultured Desulfatiglans sp.]|nr:hypothetical protein TRIP_B330557 [uncultured Desulfatiglans sp.]